MTALLEKRNHDYCQATIDMKAAAETYFLTIGQRLYEIRTKEMFKPYWSSFDEFCMEFKWDGSAASRLINIYKKFVLEYHIAPAQLVKAGGWTVLAEVLPVIRDKEDALKWIEVTQELSRSDVRKEIKSRKGTLPEEMKCRHPESKVYYLRICECGCKEVIYDVEFKGKK